MVKNQDADWTRPDQTNKMLRLWIRGRSWGRGRNWRTVNAGSGLIGSRRSRAWRPYSQLIRNPYHAGGALDDADNLRFICRRRHAAAYSYLAAINHEIHTP